MYILYYHRVGHKAQPLCASLKLFDWEMAYLKKHYQVLSLNELLDYINGDVSLERPGVVITFDDGWFDNFVYAYPILKKYGLKATVFVSTGKMRKDNLVRDTIEDCWNGKTTLNDLRQPIDVDKSWADSLSDNFNEFLTWEELRIMQKSGVFDVESHGVEHRKVFCSDTAEGMVNGKVSWSVLSASPEIKEGMPLYPVRSALAERAYYPDFSGGPGRWETEEEMKMRIWRELVESKDRISSEIGVTPLHLCWPFGEYSDTGIKLAREAGYEACYTTKPGSITDETDGFRMPRVSTSGGKLAFVKRGLIYSHPFLAKGYCLLSGRAD